MALVGRLPLAELERHVPPGGARPQDPEDPAQDGAMVVARPAGWWALGRQERTLPPPRASQGVAPCGHGLMRPAPQRPLEAEAALLAAAGQRQEEAPDLRHGDRDQAGIAAPFSWASCRLAARRKATRPACAS